MEPVFLPGVPRPAGHYAPAVIHQGLVYVSGQLPIDPRTGVKETGPIEDQARQALSDLEMVLAAAGADPGQVLRVTVYLADISLWDRFNTVYAEFFGEHRPARTVVPTGPLHFGFLVEIDAIAALS